MAAAPWRIDDPTISTVVYATLNSQRDVDYYTFDGKKGQRILMEITIPQIEGQDDFAPTLALMGAGPARWEAAQPGRTTRQNWRTGHCAPNRSCRQFLRAF